MARKIIPETLNHISISVGNTKMGPIHSVSFPPSKVCGNLPCHTSKLCYIEKAIRLYKETREAYNRNWRIYNENPEQFWGEIEDDIKGVRFFRFFVGGDIPNISFFAEMINIANRNQHCEFLCFTKKYKIVNTMLDTLGGQLPRNMHLLFSGWTGITIPNPYALPEAHVMFKDGTTTARDGAKYCSGNCYTCAKNGAMCFSLQRGEQILFSEH